jgi:curved DNA-binding protein CbpA
MRGEPRDRPAQSSLGPGPDYDQSTVDLYDLLQVSPRATLGVIRAAYRALARDYHPDTNATPGAARYMLRLNEAYDVLSDPVRRARYHRRYEQSARGPTRGATVRTARSAHPNRTHRRYHAPPPRAVSIERSTGLPMMVRVTVVALMIAAVTVSILFAWIASGDLDDRSPPTFSPRSGMFEIPAQPARGAGSFRLCDPSRAIPLSC